MRNIFVHITILSALWVGCNSLRDADAITRQVAEDTDIEDEASSSGNDADLVNNNHTSAADSGGLTDVPADTSIGEDVDSDVDSPDATPDTFIEEDVDPPDADPDASIAEDVGEDVDPLLDAEADVMSDASDDVCSEQQLASCVVPRCMEIASCTPETGRCAYIASSNCVAQGELCEVGVECINGACGGDGICGGAGAACSNQSECIPGTDCMAGVCERPTAGAMVLVEGGASIQGTDCPHCVSGPIAVVEVSAFHIDRTEVTVNSYASCVEAGGCSPPRIPETDLCSSVYGLNNWLNQATRGQHPINCVDWHQAVQYCSWVGKRLPTEAEWEKTARGPDGQTYPWGEDIGDCRYAVMREDESSGDGCGTGTTGSVGSKPAGASPYGALDMAGNVEEWVSDWFVPRRAVDGARDPQGPISGTDKVRRGSSYRSAYGLLAGYFRAGVPPNTILSYIGFRCARSAP